MMRVKLTPVRPQGEMCRSSDSAIVRSSSLDHFIAVASYAQQSLDRPTLIHRAVALGDLRERQDQIEDLPRVDRSVEHEVDELREIPPHGRRSSVQMHMSIKEIRAIELDAVRHAHVADRSAGPGRG